MSSKVVVTGAGRGLGLSLATRFAQLGHRVGATVRSPDAADELRSVAAQFPGAIEIAGLDLADTDSIASAVTELAGRLGGIDVVINSAGVNSKSLPGASPTISIETMEADPMVEMMRINTAAPLLVVRAALPRLRRSAHPRVVNISSWLGSIDGAGSGNYAYAASKAALNMSTRLLANELQADGIIAVAVNPGWIRTSMGGSRAEMSAEQSAAGIASLTESLTQQEHSGRFLQWDGTEHPW